MSLKISKYKFLILDLIMLFVLKRKLDLVLRYFLNNSPFSVLKFIKLCKYWVHDCSNKKSYPEKKKHLSSYTTNPKLAFTPPHINYQKDIFFLIWKFYFKKKNSKSKVGTVFTIKCFKKSTVLNFFCVNNWKKGQRLSVGTPNHRLMGHKAESLGE